jgi:hypothetical protein
LENENGKVGSKIKKDRRGRRIDEMVAREKGRKYLRCGK